MGAVKTEEAAVGVLLQSCDETRGFDLEKK